MAAGSLVHVCCCWLIALIDRSREVCPARSAYHFTGTTYAWAWQVGAMRRRTDRSSSVSATHGCMCSLRRQRVPAYAGAAAPTDRRCVCLHLLRREERKPTKCSIGAVGARSGSSASQPGARRRGRVTSEMSVCGLCAARCRRPRLWSYSYI